MSDKRDIVERLKNEAKIFEQTLLDDTVDLIREAAAEITRLREERLTAGEREAIQLALTLEWPHTSEQWEALAGCVGPVCKVPANKYKVAIGAFLARQPLPPGPEGAT